MRWPPRSLNRIKYKLTISLVAAVAVTMGASWFVFDRLVNRAIAIALNDDVEEGLRQGLQSRRDLFEAKKETFRATARAHARDRELWAALESGERSEVERVLARMVEGNPSTLGVTLERTGGAPPVRASREADEYPEDRWRRFEVTVEPEGLDLTLTEVFVVPWSLFDDFEEAGRVLNTFQTFRRNREDFRVGFVWFYLVTVGALAFVVGTAVFLYSLRFGRRIGRLDRATQRVGRGDLEASVHDDVGDELSDLASAFNDMVREIRRGRARIEYLQKVSAWQEFARRLAHEIKNPLTPIQLAIQEIRSTYRGDDPRFEAVLEESNEIIEEEIAVLRRLVGEFSAFARLPRVEPRPTGLDEFLAEVTPSLESFARSRGVALDVERGDVTTVVEIDASMLRRVLDNLVHNAVEAIERKGSGDGHVVLRAGREQSGRLSLRVIDDGPGIDRGRLDDVFAPYYTTRPTGTGLGLAIAKKIVLEHGGTLSIESTGDAGTTVLVELPPA
jgi:nitrogen fixation/metabolism regulation signal transduction histidine kinase